MCQLFFLPNIRKPPVHQTPVSVSSDTTCCAASWHNTTHAAAKSSMRLFRQETSRNTGLYNIHTNNHRGCCVSLSMSLMPTSFSFVPKKHYFLPHVCKVPVVLTPLCLPHPMLFFFTSQVGTIQCSERHQSQGVSFATHACIQTNRRSCCGVALSEFGARFDLFCAAKNMFSPTKNVPGMFFSRTFWPRLRLGRSFMGLIFAVARGPSRE